ncbi:hypothetical protein Cgig2_021772 [Carnegiea gigantea]|uniref:Uncharacterized protein n=1 Tax=Carnegiea gigantea TaxID=171969 RepID=A0A9Q1GN86_9CARY|nr:hypothetical protein Cgig2_021772 [Carnegiea gigantea]
MGDGDMVQHVGSNVDEGGEGEEGSSSPTIQRVPQRWNPPVMQTSPYANPEAAVGVGKCKASIGHCYRKRSKKVSTHASEEPKVQEVTSRNKERETISADTHAVLPMDPEGNEQEVSFVHACSEAKVDTNRMCMWWPNHMNAKLIPGFVKFA